jgi:hypothetical protein
MGVALAMIRATERVHAMIVRRQAAMVGDL